MKAPAKGARPAPRRRRKGSDPRTTSTEELTRAVGLAPVDILLVDDQVANLLSLEAILAPLHQNLVRAGSGEEALKLVLQRDFALILLDVQMPTIDGFETARLIKSREKSKDIPIIFLTAISREEEYVFRGYQAGAVDYLRKPFDPDMLRAKVAVFIDLYQKNQRIRLQAELLRQKSEAELRQLIRSSEERYRYLADAMPQVVWTADARGTLTYGNQRWFELSGAENDGTAPQNWADLLPREELTQFQRTWDNMVSAVEPWEVEVRLTPASAPEGRWHLVRAVPVGDGREIEWVGTATDIDDRHRLEAALQFVAEAGAVLATCLDVQRTAIEAARLAVPELGEFCAIDLRNEEGVLERVAMRYAGGEAASQPGYVYPTKFGPATVIASGQPEFEPAAAPARLAALLGSDKAAAKVRGYATIPLYFRGEPLGAITHLSATGRPIDGISRMALEVFSRRVGIALENATLFALAARRSEMLEHADRAKDQFLAILSHELRTPLSAILGWSQLLRSSPEPALLQRGLEAIARNAKIQAQLIADLLDVSRIIGGKLHLIRQPVDVKRVLEAAVETVRPTAEQRKVTLEARTWPSEAIEVLADPARLQQIVWNLLSNSIKFTPEGGKVSIALAATDGSVIIRVIDTGEGIDPTFLPRVFDRFVQEVGSGTRAHGGLGLGLAIVRHLVDLHTGTVHAESEGKGCGSTFVVELPRIEAATTRVPDSDAAKPTDTEHAFTDLRVLVIEDQEDGREFLRELCERDGAKVTTAATMREGIDAFDSASFDVILSDIGLPDGDGYTLIQHVREHENGSHTFALAVTAFAAEQDRNRAMQAGFDGHIAKPIDPNELRALVASRNGAQVSA